LQALDFTGLSFRPVTYPLRDDLRSIHESRYNNGMPDNVFDIETLRPLEALIKELGGLDECKRLGFVFEDENKIMSLSAAGLGYLLFVKAAGGAGLAEAFAAGYQCRAEES
jgi:hypothetical protein